MCVCINVHVGVQMYMSVYKCKVSASAIAGEAGVPFRYMCGYNLKIVPMYLYNTFRQFYGVCLECAYVCV